SDLGAELRQLTDEFAIFLRLQRVLVVQLGHQQFEKLVLAKVVAFDITILAELVLIKYRTGSANAVCSAHACALLGITDPGSELSAAWSWPCSSARHWFETNGWRRSCQPFPQPR